MSGQPQASERPHAAQASVEPGDSESPSTALFSRQPLFDATQGLVAYAISYPGIAEHRPIKNTAESHSARVLHTLVSQVGVNVVAPEVDLLFPVDPVVMNEMLYELLPPERTILGVSLQDVRDAETRRALQTARGKGYRLALESSVPVGGQVLASLAPNIIQTNAKLLVDNAAWHLSATGHAQARLLATHIDDHTLASRAREAGASVFSGPYHCLPESLSANPLAGTTSNRLRLVTEMSKPAIDLSAVEDIFRADVELPCGLLRYLNSSAMGMRTRITSIRHALNLMGAEPMRRWCAVAAVGAMRADAPPELLRTTLSRAKFCEGLGLASGDSERALDYFMLGLLSTLDTILQVPISRVIDGLPLHDDVRATLLGEGGSVFGNALEMARACERGAWATVSKYCTGFGLTHGETSVAYFDAIRWVSEHTK